MIMIGRLLGLSTLCGILYRLGGKEGFDTKFRDIGCSLVACITITSFGITNNVWSWIGLILSFGLMWGALTTYRYFLPKPNDYEWWHYALHGFMISIALISFIFAYGHWVGFWIRCILNSILIGLWSHFVSQDDLEEFGRGFIFNITLVLFFF